MIEFAFVPLHTFIHETVEKADRHTKDANYGEESNIDWDYYIAASKAGQCFGVTLRDKNKLVGYSVYFIDNQTNHKHIIEAPNAVLFVEKEYRGKYFKKIDQVAREHLKKMGVHEINYLIKNPRIGKALSRLGYEPTHTLWSIKL